MTLVERSEKYREFQGGAVQRVFILGLPQTLLRGVDSKRVVLLALTLVV